MLFHAEATQSAQKATMQIAAYADSHSDYPEGRRTSEAYLDRVVRHQRELGYEVLNEKKKVKLGNSTFFRADFRKEPVTEALLVTSRKGYALVFIFAGRDASVVEHLISSSRISFADQTEH